MRSNDFDITTNNTEVVLLWILFQESLEVPEVPGSASTRFIEGITHSLTVTTNSLVSCYSSSVF